MRWMVWPRQYGKSYEIGKWWLEDPQNRVIVTANEEIARIRRRELEDKLLDFYSGLFAVEITKLLKRNIMSYRSWQNMRGVNGSNIQVAIDDLDYILQSVFGTGGASVVLAAGSGINDEPDPERKQMVDDFNRRNGLPKDGENFR